MPTIKAVLFDLDETLFDHSDAARAGLMELQSRHDVLSQHPLQELEQEFRRALDETHPCVLQGLLSPDEARILRFQMLFQYCGMSKRR